MKPAAFEYYDPTTADEALALLAELGDEAKLLAGGQSLIPLMNMRLAKPANLVDLGRIAGLDYVQDRGDALALGALTRHRTVETSPLIRTACPVLAAAAEQIGHFQIRERGTLGGTLAHADPAAEIPLIATLLDAELTIRSADGERVATPADFFLTVFMTTLDASEMITEARFRKLRPREGWAVREFTRRHGDFALVAVAATVELDGSGVIRSARLSLGGAGPTPWLVANAEAMLGGERPTEALLRSVAVRVSREMDPDSDLHATADDRRDLARTLVFQTLTEAASRATSR